MSENVPKNADGTLKTVRWEDFDEVRRKKKDDEEESTYNTPPRNPHIGV